MHIGHAAKCSYGLLYDQLLFLSVCGVIDKIMGCSVISNDISHFRKMGGLISTLCYHYTSSSGGESSPAAPHEEFLAFIPHLHGELLLPGDNLVGLCGIQIQPKSGVWEWWCSLVHGMVSCYSVTLVLRYMALCLFQEQCHGVWNETTAPTIGHCLVAGFTS